MTHNNPLEVVRLRPCPGGVNFELAKEVLRVLTTSGIPLRPGVPNMVKWLFWRPNAYQVGIYSFLRVREMPAGPVREAPVSILLVLDGDRYDGGVFLDDAPDNLLFIDVHGPVLEAVDGARHLLKMMGDPTT